MFIAQIKSVTNIFILLLYALTIYRVKIYLSNIKYFLQISVSNNSNLINMSKLARHFLIITSRTSMYVLVSIVCDIEIRNSIPLLTKLSHLCHKVALSKHNDSFYCKLKRPNYKIFCLFAHRLCCLLIDSGKLYLCKVGNISRSKTATVLMQNFYFNVINKSSFQMNIF